MLFDYSENKEASSFKLFLFSFFLLVLTYGFAITNFTVTVDDEMPVLPDFGMELGRWGQNLIRYHLFNGFLPYFSLLLSLFLFSVSAVRLARLFKLPGLSAYVFCGLFVTFPQLAYQIVFSIMADVAALGVLLSILFIEFFLKGIQQTTVLKKLLYFSGIAVLLMFMLSIYQALIIIPATIYVLLFFQATYEPGFNLKQEFQKALILGATVVVGLLLTYFR